MQAKPKMGMYRPPEIADWLNYGERPQGIKIDTIILHYTFVNYNESYQMLTAESTAERPVSAHYLIREDGRIDNLVSDEKKARHAGVSNWNEKEYVNDFSIGIEIVNPGSGEQGCYPTYFEEKKPPSECKRHPFPQVQLDKVIEVISFLKSIHQDIKDYNIVGHSDITAYQARKIDPGVAFDWQYLQKHGHGIYSNTTIKSPIELYKPSSPGSAEDIKTIQAKLHTLGYNITSNGVFDAHMSNVVRAFNVHHNVDTKDYHKFDWDSWDSVADLRLDNLLHHKSHDVTHISQYDEL